MQCLKNNVKELRKKSQLMTYVSEVNPLPPVFMPWIALIIYCNLSAVYNLSLCKNKIVFLEAVNFSTLTWRILGLLIYLLYHCSCMLLQTPYNALYSMHARNLSRAPPFSRRQRNSRVPRLLLCCSISIHKTRWYIFHIQYLKNSVYCCITIWHVHTTNSSES